MCYQLMPADKQTHFSKFYGSRRTSKWNRKIFNEKKKFKVIALAKSCVNT